MCRMSPMASSYHCYTYTPLNRGLSVTRQVWKWIKHVLSLIHSATLLYPEELNTKQSARASISISTHVAWLASTLMSLRGAQCTQLNLIAPGGGRKL
jgi:hypothetical protein